MDMVRTRADQRVIGKHRERARCLRLKPCALLSACAMAMAMAMATVASAQDGIRRCIGSNGEPVFSDRPCTSPAPSGRDAGDGFAPTMPSLDTQTCATSALELRDRVSAAFDARNAIALSGLVLWDGHARGEATGVLREFARLVEEPLIAIDVDRAAGAYDDPYRPSAHGAAQVMLVVRTARDLDRVPQEARTAFDLVDHRGCWWLRLTPAIAPDRHFD